MIDKRLNAIAVAKPKFFLLFLFFGIAGGALAVGQAYFFATIVDQVFLQGEKLAAVAPLLLLLLSLFMGRSLLSYLVALVGSKLAGEVKTELRSALLEKLMGVAPGYLVQEQTGHVVGVITEAVDQIEVYFSRYLPQLIQAMTIPIIVLLVVFSNSLFSGAIMLISAPLIPVFMVLIGNMAETKTQHQLSSMLRFSGHFLDVLQGLTTLKLFGQSKHQGEEITKMSNNFRDTTMEVLKIAFLSALMLEILATISTAMIAVEVGLRLVYGHYTFHIAFFILLLAPELYQPLKNMGSSFHAGRSSITAAQQVWQVLDDQGVQAQWGQEQLSGSMPPTIVLEELTFSYLTDKPVISQLNLTINSGEKVAVVGRSGGGKSTLVKLLLGMLPPNQGRILVNNIPLTQLAEEEWFNNVAYVSQDPYLFPGTIWDNITIGVEQTTSAEVEEAARLAGVDLFVASLPQGYQTMVGEGGLGLSGGEKQRVAMARAFVKQAALVLLDEPTANLDLESEQVIRRAMTKLKQGRTVITVAHRLQTVLDADKIVVLDQGEIVGLGTHSQLLEECQLYGAMVNQYGGGA